MNLQPIYPQPHAGMRIWCAGCDHGFDARTGAADLDDVPGTYYCPACAKAHDDYIAACRKLDWLLRQVSIPGSFVTSEDVENARHAADRLESRSLDARRIKA